MTDASNLKTVVAQNIAALRTAGGITQLELGEKLNYSDKAVSKWERGASLPDVVALKQISEVFGVTVDYILTPHENAAQIPINEKHIKSNRTVITLICTLSVWALALLAFVVLWITGTVEWLIFVYALPVSLIVGLVFSSIWGNHKANFFIISALVWSIIATVYLIFLKYNWWALFLLGIPAEIIIYLCFKIRKIPLK